MSNVCVVNQDITDKFKHLDDEQHQSEYKEHCRKMSVIDSYEEEIKEVEVSCVLKENEDGTKISLRSKNYVDVSAVSAKYGGGGHAKAAGFEINDNIENTKRILLEEFKEYFG